MIRPVEPTQFPKKALYVEPKKSQGKSIDGKIRTPSVLARFNGILR
jgi:hypothetical protein